MSKPYSSSKEALKVPRKSKVRRRGIYVIIFALVLILGAGGYFAYGKYDGLKKENARIASDNAKLANPQESAKLETERVKASVAKLIDVPQDEDPTIASVVDASKLSEQAFFKNAKNGDKVVMYAQAKKAILYRPDTNKIIEVAPINIGNNEKPAAPAGTETPQ